MLVVWRSYHKSKRPDTRVAILIQMYWKNIKSSLLLEHNCKIINNNITSLDFTKFQFKKNEREIQHLPFLPKEMAHLYCPVSYEEYSYLVSTEKSFLISTIYCMLAYNFYYKYVAYATVVYRVQRLKIGIILWLNAGIY